MTVPLLSTKLRPPPLRDDAVPRPQLLARLDAGLRSVRRLTYISAPAGFGKTTLLRSWIAASSVRAAWLTLDDLDNDPVRFWTYVVAALQTVEPGLGETLRRALPDARPSSMRPLVASLINDIEMLAERLVLVLDDYHEIHATVVHDSIAFLLAYQPHNLSLALTTRVDPPLPLARMRARGQLTELRSADLRFNIDETATLLNDTLALGLAEGDIVALAERTEGWITGLQLAALSLQSSQDPHSFVVDFSGSHRYIVDYLMAEVLAHQSQAVRTFLRRTAILDRFCAPLCEQLLAVAPSVDEPAADLLARLELENVFVVPLDDERRWYRYHQLFSDFQLRRLQEEEPGCRQELHRRAGAWYQEAGETNAAMRHYLAAADYDRAVALLEARARSIIAQGQVSVVESWFRSLPERWRTSSPTTNLTFAWALLMRGQYAQAMTYLENAECALNETSIVLDARHRQELTAEVHAMQSIRARLQGETAQAEVLAEQAVAEVPDDAPYASGLAHASLGALDSYMGHTAQAVIAYERAVDAYQTAGTLAAELLAASNLLVLALRQGRLRYATALCDREIAALGEAASQTPAAGSLYGMRGLLHYEGNELDAAEADLTLSLKLGRLIGHPAATAYTLATHAQLLRARGEAEPARARLDEAYALVQHGAPGWVRAQVMARRVVLALAQDDPDAAEQALDGVIAADGHQDVIRLAHLRLALYLGIHHDGTQLAAAQRRADDLIADATDRGHGGTLIEALILRARVYEAQGRRPMAEEDLVRALELAEPEGYVRTIVDVGKSLIPLLQRLKTLNVGAALDAYARRLLAAFGLPVYAPEQPQPTPSLLVEPLSDREQQVLHLLAQGLTYREIADRLVVSVNTVRYHIKNLYGKLNADKRTVALARARELELL